VAVPGLRGQHNPLVHAGGQWREGVYVPACIRRYPFIVHENAAGTELTLCIDEAAGQLPVDHRADVSLHNGRRLSLTGFKVIDESRCAQLPDATFLQWQ
jgi:SapC